MDVVIGLIVIVSSIIIIKSSMIKSGSQNKVVVEAAGETYEYALSKDGVYEVQGELGLTTIEISNGKVRIIDSPCPNKTCINQGLGSTLVCLPNKVIVTVVQEDGEFDAIVQ